RGAPWHLPPPRAPQASKATDGDPLPRAQSLTLAVPYLAVPGTTRQRLARVCTRPAVTALCRPRRPHGGGGQWRARPALVPGEESRVVYRARRPADARHQPPAGSGP